MIKKKLAQESLLIGVIGHLLNDPHLIFLRNLITDKMVEE